jgi:hypothetical protein
MQLLRCVFFLVIRRAISESPFGFVFDANAYPISNCRTLSSPFVFVSHLKLQGSKAELYSNIVC